MAGRHTVPLCTEPYGNGLSKIIPDLVRRRNALHLTTGTTRSLAGTRFLEMPEARKLSATAEYAGKMGTQDQIWTRHRVAALRLTTDGRAKPGHGGVLQS